VCIRRGTKELFRNSCGSGKKRKKRPVFTLLPIGDARGSRATHVEYEEEGKLRRRWTNTALRSDTSLPFVSMSL
jgi:hypothetical protein